MATELLVRPWQRLSGKIAPEVLVAPKTGGDPRNHGDWPEVHERVVAYLEANVVGKPWANHLALVAAVLTARRRDVGTVLWILQNLHPRFTAIFPALGLASMEDWEVDQHLPAYLKGELLPEDSPYRRIKVLESYNSAAKQLGLWFDSLPDPVQPVYRAWVLPPVRPDRVHGLAKWHEVKRHQQQTRKAETDAVVPQFSALRAEAHFRYNRLARLRQAFHDVLRKLPANSPSALPLAFSYEEGADPEKGVQAQERLHFRIWDRRSFVLAHADSYCKATVAHARRGRATSRGSRWC